MNPRPGDMVSAAAGLLWTPAWDAPANVPDVRSQVSRVDHDSIVIVVCSTDPRSDAGVLVDGRLCWVRSSELTVRPRP